MDRIIIFFLIFSNVCFSQQKPFPKIAFGKNITATYIGSGAASRHMDWNTFKAETENYRRTPFIAMGFDKCVLPYASNAYWGIGAYTSSWAATLVFT